MPMKMVSATLPQLFSAACEQFGSREMLAFAPLGKVTVRLSGLELRALVDAAATALATKGVTKGTHVGLLCTNRPEWVAWAFGAWRLGAVVVPLSTLWKPAELAFALRHADVELLIGMRTFRQRNYAADLAAVVPDVAGISAATPLFSPSVPTLRHLLFFEPEDSAPPTIPASAPELSSHVEALTDRVTPADRAAIFFTSGTTAQPKAVVHAHESLVISASRIAQALGIDASDTWWGHMPLFWTGGFVLGLLATWSGGGRVVLQERVEPASTLRLLETERCTIMAGWHQAGPLLEHPDFSREKIALRKGSIHPLAERFLATPHFAVGMYGLSETATCVACARWDDPPEVRTSSCGHPLPGTEVRIVDPEAGTELPPEATGEICVRGVTLMEGYYKVPRSETFDPEGFFHTGDLGFLDHDGRLHFVGRLKDVIKTAGVNVSAAEVEELLAQHPAVAAAHVVGVPHPVRGENVAAFVVLRNGASASDDDLLEFCRQRLASYKVPRHVLFIEAEEVPRTASGKIEKAKLRLLAAKRLQQGARETPNTGISAT